MREENDCIYSLLSMKTNLENQLYFFTDLLEESYAIKFEFFKNYIENSNMENIIENFNKLNNESEIERKIKDIKNLIRELEQKIKSECVHTYEEDSIDITPDRSQNITYCSKCWSSF